jgi:hypothetical protein
MSWRKRGAKDHQGNPGDLLFSDQGSRVSIMEPTLVLSQFVPSHPNRPSLLHLNEVAKADFRKAIASSCSVELDEFCRFDLF